MNNKKTKRINISLSSEELRQLQELAYENQKNVSEYIRHLIFIHSKADMNKGGVWQAVK
jgi:uncharacterized membrane protein YecN with MAPEG domain